MNGLVIAATLRDYIVKGVSDISVTNWMKKNNLQSIAKIEMNFLVWNKITVDGKHIFDEGLFERRKREYQLYQMH